MVFSETRRPPSSRTAPGFFFYSRSAGRLRPALFTESGQYRSAGAETIQIHHFQASCREPRPVRTIQFLDPPAETVDGKSLSALSFHRHRLWRPGRRGGSIRIGGQCRPGPSLLVLPTSPLQRETIWWTGSRARGPVLYVNVPNPFNRSAVVPFPSDCCCRVFVRARGRSSASTPGKGELKRGFPGRKVRGRPLCRLR